MMLIHLQREWQSILTDLLSPHTRLSVDHFDLDIRYPTKEEIAEVIIDPDRNCLTEFGK